MSELPTYVLERVFDAPRELVWRTWTEPELLARWYGPNVETIIHRFELEPGGLWLNEMRWGDNANFSRATFTEVTPPQRLVWHHAVTDGAWNPIANPMMPDWPRVLLTVVTFTESGGRTEVRLTWTPHEASEAELACFAAALAGLDKGWGAGMTLLAELLEELQAATT